MTATDGSNLCVSHADGPPKTLALDNDIGVVDRSGFVEGKNSTVEVIVHHCLNLFREVTFSAAVWKSANAVEQLGQSYGRDVRLA